MFLSRFSILRSLIRNFSRRHKTFPRFMRRLKVNFERLVQPYLERIPSDSLIFLISDRGFIESTDSQDFSEETLQIPSGEIPPSTLHWFIKSSHGHRFRSILSFSVRIKSACNLPKRRRIMGLRRGVHRFFLQNVICTVGFPYKR